MAAKLKIKKSDLEKILGKLKLSSEKLKQNLRGIMRHNFNITRHNLIAKANLHARTGNLAKTVTKYDDLITQRGKTGITGQVGFTDFSGVHDPERVEAYAEVATKTPLGSKTNIEPTDSEQLAFPTDGSPAGFRDSRGVQLVQVEDAARNYHLIFTDKAIMGRPLDDSDDSETDDDSDLVFLFLRKESVQSPSWIDMEAEEENLYERIIKDIEKNERLLDGN